MVLRRFPGFFVYSGRQALGLLIDKGAGAGSAWPVGIEAFEFPASVIMADLKQRGILSAHTDDASGLRYDMQHTQNLADGLKLIKDAQFLGKLLAVVSGKGDGSNVALPEFLKQTLNQIPNLFIYFSEVTFIWKFKDNLFAPVDNDAVQAD